MKMTASLLNAYDWYLNCPESWKERAIQSLHDNLVKGFTANQATIRGNNYEDKVVKLLNEGYTLHSAEQILNIVNGLPTQQWIKCLELEVPDIGTFQFRGKMDFVDRPRRIIYDLKTTKRFIDPQRYMDGKQHLIYSLAEGYEEFHYLVARFEDDEGLEPIEVQDIPVIIDLEHAKDVLVQSITGLVTFLREANMWEDYFTIFNSGRP